MRTIQPELKEKLTLPTIASSYPAVITTVSQPEFSISFSQSLTRTEKNYYGSKAEIPEGYRMSTAAEELAIQLSLERAGHDPRQAEVFNDLFARNEGKWYAWQ